jgi:hypothetical protein
VPNKYRKQKQEKKQVDPGTIEQYRRNTNYQPYRNDYLDKPASGRVNPDKVKIKRVIYE